MTSRWYRSGPGENRGYRSEGGVPAWFERFDCPGAPRSLPGAASVDVPVAQATMPAQTSVKALLRMT